VNSTQHRHNTRRNSSEAKEISGLAFVHQAGIAPGKNTKSQFRMISYKDICVQTPVTAAWNSFVEALNAQ
jgi:hypothetical protein